MDQIEQIEKPETHSVEDLEKLYQEDDEADKELFAEMRSNILLKTGDHYNKMRSNFFKRLRDSRGISQEQKIRLTKNHIQKIANAYANHILSTAPGVGFEPAQQSELQDQKNAEMNRSVWEYAKEKNSLDEQVQAWVEDFVDVGEVATKIFFDPSEGASGEILFEEVYGFNLLVDCAATSFKKAKRATIRKMVDLKKLKKMYPEEEHAKALQESSDQTYTIFERGKGGYQKSKGECLVRETYFRPGLQYPNGYVYIWVKGHILFEGELPAGIFPIIQKPFNRLQTKARGQSVIKTLRPYQAEINRSGSKIAEHQITLGDDKLLVQHGTKVTSGVSLPGVRTANYTGMAPVVLPGRDGSQYLNYMNSQITEMYNAAMVDEKPAEMSGQLDAYSLLFRSASQKKQFQLYIRRFEAFLKEVCSTYLELARYHFTDDMVIQMAGRKERVNIAEFRDTSPLCYKIKVTAQSEDIETKLGKQLVLNHVLQYVGNQLGKEDIGKLIKAMPYSNQDESFNDLTMDYESATNDILALDRGEQPPVHPNDPHPYMVKRLTARMRQADFQFLNPQVQNNYQMRLQAHEQFIAQQAQAIQMAEAGFIPTGGYLVACDFYVQSDANDPSKTKRVRMPSESLQWLIQKLETQGSSLDQLENVNQQNLAEIAAMTQQSGGAAPEAQAPTTQNLGDTMPGGVPNVRPDPGTSREPYIGYGDSSFGGPPA